MYSLRLMAYKKLNRHAREWRSERINLSLTKQERKKLGEIAAKEDRDMGYIGAWMIRWGIDMYEQFGGASIVNLADMELYRFDQNKAEARFYLNRLKREVEQLAKRKVSMNGNSVQRKRDLLSEKTTSPSHRNSSLKSTSPIKLREKEIGSARR